MVTSYNDIRIYFKKVVKEAKLPEYATMGAAGCDLSSVENVQLSPGNSHMVRTGLCIEMPKGIYSLIRPRSGIAAKHKVILNSSGVVDGDYRGELLVPLLNLGEVDFIIKPGDRIAQMIFMSYFKGHFIEVMDELENTERGACGFGSTGKN